MREWQVACSLQFITPKRRIPPARQCVEALSFSHQRPQLEPTYHAYGWKSGDRFTAVSRTYSCITEADCRFLLAVSDRGGNPEQVRLSSRVPQDTREQARVFHGAAITAAALVAFSFRLRPQGHGDTMTVGNTICDGRCMRASPFDVTSPTQFVPALSLSGTPGVCWEGGWRSVSAWAGSRVSRLRMPAKRSTGTRSSDWLTGLTCLSGWLG